MTNQNSQKNIASYLNQKSFKNKKPKISIVEQIILEVEKELKIKEQTELSKIAQK